MGRQIISAENEKAARADAFLRVPLYAAIFEKYKGHLLPPMKALEREMQALGVSSKQTDKARQAFERSARQAGYFELGDERLVRPKVSIVVQSAGDAVEPSKSVGGADAEAQQTRIRPEASGYHPFIEGLLKTLPEPGTDWSTVERGKWLQTAASIFGLIYRGDGTVRVEVVEERSNGIASNGA